MGNSVFLRLADVASDLPAYEERVMVIPLDAEADAGGFSQAGCYADLATRLRQAVNDALRRGSKRLLATYLQALISYPDACTKGEIVLDPESGTVLAEAPPLSAERLYPKEQAILDLFRRDKERGRRAIIYVTHTERRDVTPRIRSILEREGLRVAVLKASTVPADRREEWLAALVREGIDVLACHPALVSTGLVVLFAVRKARPTLDPEAEERVRLWASWPLDPLPDEPEEPLVTVPAVPRGEILFAPLIFDPDLAAEEARRRGVWVQAQLADQLWPPDQTTVRPLMPLRRGHLALLIAAGMLNNLLVGDGETRVLIKGRTYKEFVALESDDEDTVAEREVLRTSVTLLDLNSGNLEKVEES